MCSYNKINGSWSCENEWTTNYLLKNELNFQGFGMLDPSGCPFNSPDGEC